MISRAGHGAAEPARDTIQPTPTGPVTLPPPYATPSAERPARVVRTPTPPALRTATGFRATVFADGFEGARWLARAPNGDVFVSEHTHGRIWVLRDADGDGTPEVRTVFAEGLTQPFGMAFDGHGFFYVGDTDEVVRFAYAPGALQASGPPQHLIPLPGRGYHQHWTRNVIVSPDGARLFVTVGSATNDSVERDARRGAVSVYDLDGSHGRVFASGLRNPVGIAFHPRSGALFAVVNERDDLGDDLVPDYLTTVRDGAFYGWPFAYFGPHEDPNHRGERPDLVAHTTVPDLSLGAHVAALGLMFHSGHNVPADYAGDAIVTEHGSWNRSAPVGYRVVRVHFRDGRPTAEIDDFVSGWLGADGTTTGRPVGVVEASDGSVLIADDGAGRIWRVAYALPITR